MLSFLRKKTKTIMIVVAVVFAASMFYGIGMSRSWSGLGGKTVGLAKVNGQEIDSSRYNEMLGRVARQFGGQVRPQDMAFVEQLALGQTVDFTLVLAAAQRKAKVSRQEVDMAVDNIMKQQGFASKKDLEAALKRVGLSLNKLRDMVKDEMLVQKMVMKIRNEAKVSPDDLREVRASHILVSTEAEAQNLLVRIKKGEDFAKLAREYSMDNGTKAKGGDLGFFSTGMMVEPFEKAAFSLKIGEISSPIKTSFGYHIIKVSDSRLRKFAGQEKDVERAALQDKQEKAFRKWFSVFREKAKIEIESPKLKGHDLRFKGKPWEAAQEYKKAIQANPTDPYLHVFLADTYNAAGKPELAFSEYEAAIGVESGNPGLYIIYGNAYEQKGQKEEALKQYRCASMIGGDNKAVHEGLLKVFERLKSGADIAQEKSEIKRIEKKEKFEKSLQGK